MIPQGATPGHVHSSLCSQKDLGFCWLRRFSLECMGTNSAFEFWKGCRRFEGVGRVGSVKRDEGFDRTANSSAYALSLCGFRPVWWDLLKSRHAHVYTEVCTCSVRPPLRKKYCSTYSDLALGRGPCTPRILTVPGTQTRNPRP